MRYTPDYQIELSGGAKVPLLFNTWTFREYTRLKKQEFEDLIENVQTGKVFKANDLPDLLLLAAQSYFKFNDSPCNYTEVDACSWLDELGGMNSMRLLDLYKVFVGKLTGISPEQLDAAWTTAEEKTEAKKKNSEEPGKISM
jgi:hypothetical protein